MERKIGRKELRDVIYERLGGSVPKPVIYNAINVICEELVKMILAHEPISVANFGTLSVFSVALHRGWNVHKKCVTEVGPVFSAKLHAAKSFLRLLRERRERFLDPKGKERKE